MIARLLFLVAAPLFLLQVSLLAEQDPDGALRILSRRMETFSNPDCKETDTCDLKKFSITVEDYKITVNGEEFFGTRVFAEFETDKVDNLPNYGFAHFIKGCVFESFVADGAVVKLRSVSKYNFDNAKKYHFPEWVIDSIDSDPFYWSMDGRERHYLYYWNTTPGSFNPATRKFYGEEKPDYPRLYVTDRPGQAFFSNGSARNISLEFRLCIYKAGDIPGTTTEDNVNFAMPIRCFDWQSSFVYNHATGVFESKTELDQFCR